MMAHLRGRRTFLLLPGLFFLIGGQGCATRGWVHEQITPLAGQVSEVDAGLRQMGARISDVEGRVVQADGKADRAMDRLDHIRLERRLILSFQDGANFVFGSDALTEEARRAIDKVLGKLKDTDDALFLVAGHTDSIGPEDYNYALGQRRAASVAKYLITRKGVDPLRVTAVSYGKSAPLADNATWEGRRKNRRIEILLYKEAIATSPGRQRLELRPAG